MEKRTRKVRMTLVGADGNAFVLMAHFHGQARRQGWPSEEIDAVLNEARSSDYAHLLSTLVGHIEEPSSELEE